MNTLKYINYNIFNQPQSIKLTKNGKVTIYDRVKYANEWSKYITINGISYVE